MMTKPTSEQVTFLAAGSGATQRTVLDKLRDVVSVKDFGAVGNGVADDTAAIQAAIDAHSKVFFPEGTYKTTAPIQFNSYNELFGESKGGIAGKTKINAVGAIAAFVSKTKGVSAAFHPVFRDLTINNSIGSFAGILAGTSAIDLTDTSFAVVERCSWRYHQYGCIIGGTLAGYYNSVLDCEMSSCTNGLRFITSGNSCRVIGGRVHTCTIGIYGIACNDHFISCAIENCETGIDLDSGCAGWMIHSRYEGNGRLISTNAIINTIAGAAVLLRSGTQNNHVFGFASGGSDRIIDLGNNFSHVRSTGYSGVAPHGRQNLFYNESLEYDSNADGVADQLALSAALPAGTTLAIDSVQYKTGAASQRYEVAAAGSSRRDLNVNVFNTTVGVNYVFATRVKTNLANGWNLRSGTSFADTTYANLQIGVVDEWTILTFTFTATTTTSHVYFFTNNSTVGGGLVADAKLWIDSIYFGVGQRAPEFGEMARVRSNSVTYDPPSLNDGDGVTTTVACAGVSLGDYVSASFSNDLQGIMMTAWISSANTVSVRFQNETGGVLDLASGTLSVFVNKA
jgi:hypothetical protein